jgi:hypothetical protein
MAMYTDRLPLSLRSPHSVRAARSRECEGLVAVNRRIGRRHSMIDRLTDEALRLGYLVERMCKRAIEANERQYPLRTPTGHAHSLTAPQARERLSSLRVGSTTHRLTMPVLFAVNAIALFVSLWNPDTWAIAAVFVALSVGVQFTLASELGKLLWAWRDPANADPPCPTVVMALHVIALLLLSALNAGVAAVNGNLGMAAATFVLPWLAVQVQAGDGSQAAHEAAALSKIVRDADRIRRRSLRAADDRIAVLVRLGSRVERESERLQFLAGAIAQARAVRTTPDLTYVMLALNQLDVAIKEAQAWRAEVDKPAQPAQPNSAQPRADCSFIGDAMPEPRYA